MLKAGDGADALRILTHQTPDVVVCDEVMPALAGPQLVEVMKATTRLARIPVIVMGDGLVDGATMVEKPVMVPQLLALIEQLHLGAVR